jgi:hypothetical protein
MPMPPSAPPARPPSGGAARTVLLVLGIGMVGLVLVAGCSVAAVTFLGKAATTTTLDATSDSASDGAGADASTWTTFAPPGAGFTVDLPGTPKAQTHTDSKPGETITTHGFELVVNDTEYTVGYIDIPPGATYNLDEGITAIAGGVNGTVADKVPVNYAGNPAIDATITSATGERGRVRLLVAGPRAYFMIVDSTKDPTATEADFTQLVNSLKLG